MIVGLQRIGYCAPIKGIEEEPLEPRAALSCWRSMPSRDFEFDLLASALARALTASPRPFLAPAAASPFSECRHSPPFPAEPHGSAPPARQS